MTALHVDPPAIELMLRRGPRGLVRHALAEGAAESFCGVDRSILTDGSELIEVARVSNCGVCMAGAQRASGLGHYMRRAAG